VSGLPPTQNQNTWKAIREQSVAEALTIEFGVLAPRLTEAEGQRWLALLLKQIDRTTSPFTLRAVAQALRALPMSVTDAQIQIVFDPVVTLIDDTTVPFVMQSLVGAVHALAPKLSDARELDQAQHAPRSLRLRQTRT
jgi:hypothetical protein